MLISEVRIIDKKYSKFDEKRSDPKKGKYAWLSKEYIDRRFFDRDRQWFFTAILYDKKNDFLRFEGDQIKYGYEPLEAEGRFIPEGAILNESGYWKFMDLVFVKCPLIEHLKRREKDINIAKAAGPGLVKELNQQFKDEGAALPDEVIDRMMGSDVDQAESKRRSLKTVV